MCSLVEIRSLLLQGIDCPFPGPIPQSTSVARALVEKKGDSSVASTLDALESASQHCIKTKMRKISSPDGRGPFLQDTNPDFLQNTGALSSINICAVGAAASVHVRDLLTIDGGSRLSEQVLASRTQCAQNQICIRLHNLSCRNIPSACM